MPPSTPRAARRAPEAAKRGRPSRRAEIFASALHLFRERGFHATSINDIGAEAGVAGTAIYSHFATKQEVLAEAIREGARPHRGRGMEEALADDDAVARGRVSRGWCAPTCGSSSRTRT